MIRKKMRFFEKAIENIIFTSRWLLVPFYIGLVIALAGLMVQFVYKLYITIPHFMEMPQTEAILVSISMIDMSLTGNLIVMVIFAGYENFISKIDLAEAAERPVWMGAISFSDLKLKLMASIVAISAIHLLEAFMDLEKWSDRKLAWLIGIHVTFMISALMLTWMDMLSSSKKSK